ncbi:MAG: DUF6525 family protein [Pseudomonadota bacterium]
MPSKKANNSGATSLKRRRHRADPMGEYDRLPKELRAWLATAILPWSATSARQAFTKALGRTRDPALALQELDALQAKLISRDASAVWGGDYPDAGR